MPHPEKDTWKGLQGWEGFGRASAETMSLSITCFHLQQSSRRINSQSTAPASVIPKDLRGTDRVADKCPLCLKS